MPHELWRSAAFHDQARVWVAEQLATRGVELTGQWDQPHARVWSSTIRFETTDGRVWLKVNGRGTSHEPALVRVLGETVPELVPEVLSVDLDRCWSLARDAGPMLREVLAPDQSWAPWEGVVARYAEAQLALSQHRDLVLASRVPEVSPATIPGQARALVEELAELSVDSGGLGVEHVGRLQAVLPRLDSWCAELGDSAVPDSVQHDDLHSGNVCWSGSVSTARVIDWGDTSWGCPLGTMLSTMNSVAFYARVYVEGRPVDDPAVHRVRDAYLEPFTSYATRAELVRHVDLARRTGCVARAMSWRAALVDASRAEQAELEFPVRGWLLSLLDAW